MGYPHTHFQGPIGGGPAIDPKFPPTEDYLSPYHHHHHHMHLNHHHHASISPLHNGYAGPGGNGGSTNAMVTGGVGSNLQPVDYYGNSNNLANSNYNYAAQSNNNYYNQQQQQQHQSQHHSHHHHHHLPPPPPTVASPANGSPSVFNLNSATSSGNSVPGSNNNNVAQPSNLDAYNNGSLTEMASAPSTTSTVSAAAAAALNHSAMHPYSAATAAVTSSPGLGLSTGGSGAAGGLVNSYYGGYYGAAAAQVEPTNTALELQELGKFRFAVGRRGEEKRF